MGKTITTYLIDDTPQGVQYVIIGNKTCKMYTVPRASLRTIKDREELQRPALYILIGGDEEGKPEAYIGESENVYERLKNHDDKKDFWLRALVFISNDCSLNKADVRYLEHLAISVAHKAEQYSISENKTRPCAPSLQEHQKATVNEFFDDIKMLALFTGCRIFNIIEQKKHHLFYIKGRGSNAKGFYDDNGFTVLSGSQLSKDTVPSFGDSWRAKRTSFIKDFARVNSDGFPILQSNYTFSSPSTAADFCTGSSNNGWLTWKDDSGRTLDDLFRKELE